jgi:transposase-like protein
MADERHIVMTVECQHCKAKQKVHLAGSTGGTRVGRQMIRCINCEKYFNVQVPDKIVGGPFPA